MLIVLHNQVLKIRQDSIERTRSVTTIRPSRFATLASTVKPALGTVFEQFVDLHVLVAQLPRLRVDAETLVIQPGQRNGNSSPSTEERCRKVEWTNVIEILHDDCVTVCGSGTDGVIAAREGRWGVVDVFDGVELKDAFQEASAHVATGIGISDAEKMGIQLGVGMKDVGSVAKIYGFGGRRV